MACSEYGNENPPEGLSTLHRRRGWTEAWRAVLPRAEPCQREKSCKRRFEPPLLTLQNTWPLSGAHQAALCRGTIKAVQHRNIEGRILHIAGIEARGFCSCWGIVEGACRASRSSFCRMAIKGLGGRHSHRRPLLSMPRLWHSGSVHPPVNRVFLHQASVSN